MSRLNLPDIRETMIYSLSPSYDTLLKSLMLRFTESYIREDLDIAEKALVMLVASLRRKMKPEAKMVLEEYYEKKERKLREYENKKAKFIHDEEELRRSLLEDLLGAYEKLVNLMDKYGLLLREEDVSPPKTS